MKITAVSDFSHRTTADLFVLPFWEGPMEACKAHPFSEKVHSLVSAGDFQGKQGETALLYLEKEKEPRLLLLGLGKEEKVTAETLRRSFAQAVRLAKTKKVKSLNLLIPDSKTLSRSHTIEAMADGLFLTNYAFHLKKEALREEPIVLLEAMHWIGLEGHELPLVQRSLAIAETVYFVRDLVNGNADDITPQKLAETALSLQKQFPSVRTTLFDKKKLEEEKMGLILAVNRASNLDPYLIFTSYQGNPHSKEHVVLVGKGITYDTGGLQLKPPDNMLTMKCDMSGAATVLGVVQAAAKLDLKVNVTAVAPVTENSIGSKSYKLGDVYPSYSGKTVEVNNTDAEGRLVLADALSYAVKHLHPSCLIDVASLTGNIVLALGEAMAGFFTNENRLAKELVESGEKTGELLWHMPLNPDYKEAIYSEIADLVNTGGREAGAMKAAFFLQEFVGSVPWAHIDFAGPCYVSKPKHYHPTKGTGFGVRLLLDFLEHRFK